LRRKKQAFHAIMVKIPMMPKGVEHQALQTVLGLLAVREDSNDAERR
jgi:hypothetical protein